MHILQHAKFEVITSEVQSEGKDEKSPTSQRSLEEVLKESKSEEDSPPQSLIYDEILWKMSIL